MPCDTPVALIGIGCKFPGGSDTKDLYYEFLRNKVCHVHPDVSSRLLNLIFRAMAW
jgi:acyl transferase domain-containing protein